MIRQSDESSGPNPSQPGSRSLLRSVERALASKTKDPSVRAQELFYEALDAPTDEAQLALLEKALKLDSGNVEVLLALLRYENLSPVEEIEFLKKLVKLAEARLGPKAFKEFAGAFWGFHETRPYMRAREMLAGHLRVARRLEEAVAEYEGMLELNPGDNQGVRYSLLPCLLILRRLEAARKLFEKYPEEFEWNAVFAWGRVLERFLSEDPRGAESALAVARKQNPHMQAYVKGHRSLPKHMPVAYAPGSKDEAICFADVVRAAWLEHPAALTWLQGQKATRP
jgi:tetratricopeptide (TPR) repeat protein